MSKNRLLASLAVASGLVVGGGAALIFGPTASGAQTETPSTQAPAPNADGTTPPAHDGKNCPNMGGQGQGTGQAPATGSSTSGAPANTQQLDFRRF